MASEMRKSDAFILTSRFETFGVVLTEALACGIPIISTKTSGPMYIVNDENGILVEIDDEQGIANAMLDMKKNYSLYNKKIIRENCESLYSKEVITNKLVNEYERQLANRK